MGISDLYGPWALITGASEGTGAAFAHKVAAQGLNCVLVARREGPLAALADEIRAQHGVECVTALADLATSDACDQIVAAVGDRDIGLLVTTAGADTNGSGFFEREIENWVKLVNLNVMTTMRLCHHFGQGMRERRRGGMILIGSGACYGGLPGLSVYSGVKAFDLCFGEGLWAELRPYGVNILNLILGRTDTPAFRTWLAEKGLPVPADLAAPNDIAEVGLDRLPYGPVHNWGQDENVVGYAPTSAAQRRDRIVAIQQRSLESSKA